MYWGEKQCNLIVSTAELAVLLAFNSVASLSLRHLRKTTSLSEDDLQTALLALSTAPHAVLAAPALHRGVFRPEDTFTINDMFVPQQQVVHVHATAVVSPQRHQQRSTAHDAFVDLVDAAITRVVKHSPPSASSGIPARDVVELVINMCRTRVPLAADFVSDRIRRLMDDGYVAPSPDGLGLVLVFAAEAVDAAPPALSRAVSVDQSAELMRSNSTPEPGLVRVQSVQQDVALTLALGEPMAVDGTPGFCRSEVVLQQLWSTIAAVASALQVSPSLALLVLSDRRARWDPRCGH